MVWNVSPPKKITVIISIIIVFIGIIVSIIGYFSLFPSEIIIFDIEINEFFVYAGLVIIGFGWFLIFLGTRLRGI
ncbi:MAG: hypothetical protein KGD63_03635 [Candidatus Lokiarchaeota archaeon]|nr:hypothetical protein [Candidatus Lokiarchaeota archaeon]